MSKCEFILAQPINIIADVYTVEYDLIEGIIKNKGVIPDLELRIATSDLKKLAFTLGDIYNANMNACFDCECRIESYIDFFILFLLQYASHQIGRD